MEPINPKEIKNLGVYGVIREAEVDSNIIPDGAVSDVMNFSFDRKGVAILRPGTVNLGSTISAGNPCLGIFNAQSKTIIAGFLTSVYNYSDSNTWDAGLTGLVSGKKSRYVDFAGRTIFINGTADSMRVWNGSNSAGWVSTGNPINPQNLYNNGAQVQPQFVEVYKSRVYVAGDSTNPDRLLFSSVISSAGNITWTPTTDFVDINPSDGENITGLKRYSLELLVFKPNYIYRFRTSGSDPDPLIKIGTRSQESVIEGKKGLYFHHDSGFYKYTGGYPVEISRPISDFTSNITYANYSNVSSWKDSDHIYWFVGDVTINDPVLENQTWKNVVLRYTESSEVWTIYSYPFAIKVGTTFNNGSALTQVVGMDNGAVATFNSGASDLGEPIKYRVVTNWYQWEGLSTLKMIQSIVAICEKAQGSLLMYRTDDEMVWHDLGQLRKFINYFMPLSIKFHRIQFKLTGVSSVEALIFKGLEIPQVLNEGIVKQ